MFDSMKMTLLQIDPQIIPNAPDPAHISKRIVSLSSCKFYWINSNSLFALFGWT